MPIASLRKERLNNEQLVYHCYVCGGCLYFLRQVLWKELVAEWQLSPAEAEIMNLQQGLKCKTCNTHMRGNVLAYAILKCLRSKSSSLAQLISEEQELIESARVLEINEAGNLGGYLGKFLNHRRISYPEFDMHDLSGIRDKYEVVIHSDTLEHVRNPIHALSECKKVLAEGGHLIYTVPLISGRMTRSRSGLPSSSHSREKRDDYHVETEFGADFWRYPIEAGFPNLKFFTIAHPIALAIAAHE